MRVWYYDKPRTQFLFTRGSLYLGFTCARSGKILAAGNLPPPKIARKKKKTLNNTEKERNSFLGRSDYSQSVGKNSQATRVLP